MKNQFSYLCLLFTTVTLLSCGTTSEYTLVINDVSMTAEGPLFEGVNTATGSWTVDISEFLNEHNASLDDIKSARLLNAALVMEDSINFDILSEVTFLMAGDNTEMRKVALLNPVPFGQTSIALSIAEEQKQVAAFFKESAITFVADVNIIQDTFIDLKMKGNFTFELSLKQ
jgi:hypothetical protein